jgi:hypothetical protein
LLTQFLNGLLTTARYTEGIISLFISQLYDDKLQLLQTLHLHELATLEMKKTHTKQSVVEGQKIS